jgi:hydroxymethylbilane synthase
LWQANHVAERLRPLVGVRTVELVEIETSGDVDRTLPLSQIGGLGVFTKEIQRALLAGSVDVAVHSLKDLPTLAAPGLILAAVPRRGPTGDVLVSHRHRSFDSLPSGAVVATSSLRRRAQILHRRPDLRTVDVRGNVETRLAKLREQNLDATILAQAGLQRLGLADVITEVLDPTWMLPAVGQGALGLECREDDRDTAALLRQLDDPATHQAVLAERAMLRKLLGGCQVPIGAAAALADTDLTLRGVVLSPDGSRRIADTLTGPASEPETLGSRLAEELLARGARDLLGS